ncbi:MAG: hypothetical protein ACKOEE_09250, partial [Tagaea sp.]
LLVTADHGNCECMLDPVSGQAHTAHTLNPVPVYVFDARLPGRNAPVHVADGKLADVAPTLLELMGLAPPPEMTGRALIAVPACGRARRHSSFARASPRHLRPRNPRKSNA